VESIHRIDSSITIPPISFGRFHPKIIANPD